MSFEGKHVVVSGCYSGIGAEVTAELTRLGAAVHGLDYRQPVEAPHRFTLADLRNRRSIARAALEITEPVDAIFNCAGLSSLHPPLDVVSVNFIGLRYFTELLFPKIANGGCVASISSVAGGGWRAHMEALPALIGTTDFKTAVEWSAARSEIVGAGYVLSKEACIVWTKTMAAQVAARGIRFNCICPGAVDTPMLEDLLREAPTAALRAVEQPMGRKSTALEQAKAMLFLNSDAASYVSGHDLYVDVGYSGAVAVGQLEHATFSAGKAT